MTSKTKFYCNTCDHKFEGKKTRLESVHPIYGPCWKYVAKCPECKELCDEYKIKVAVKSSSESECCRERSGGNYHSGGCGGCCN